MTRRASAIVVSVAVLVLSACGTSGSTGGTAASGSLPAVEEEDTQPRLASTPEWTEAAATFAASKKELVELSTVDGELQNLPEANYLSNPVDITKPGKYVLVFDEMKAEHAELGFVVVAPEDTSFSYVIGAIRSFTEDGTATLEIEIEIPEVDFRAPYLGFSVWIV